MKILPALFLILSLATTSAAVGHEFWLAPKDYLVAPEQNIVADLRVGQNFDGGAFAYVPANFKRFEMINGKTVIAVKGRIGDRPALNMPVPNPGLWIVVHETSDSQITYREWEKFTGFVEHKGFPDTLKLHAERGLPQTDFRENYRRFVKSLIAVGDGTGADRVVGMRTEIVAQINPYTDNVSNGLPVLVLFEGTPRINVQVEIFDRAPSGQVVVTTTRTDAKGVALIPVQNGHEYNLDAVVMLPLQAEDPLLDPSWESLWAGLTFKLPD
jgi:uncharacterized GH25 family protein